MMNNEIQIVEEELKYTLEIKASVPMWKLPTVIGKSYKSIAAYMDKVNVKCTDAPFVRYTNINWEEVNNESGFSMFIEMFTRKWNMLIGFPVAEKVEGLGEILSGNLAKGKYVKTMHYGPYQKVGETYKKMMAWVKENNLEILNESIEVYLNDPRTTPKADLQTIVLIPIVG